MLAEENRSALERLGKLSAAGDAPDDYHRRLLRVALKNELEASEVAAIWMNTTSELDVKLAFARQVGDEAKHYRLISERLEQMGFDASNIDPREGGYSPLFEYLRRFRALSRAWQRPSSPAKPLPLCAINASSNFAKRAAITKRQPFTKI